MSDSDQLVFCEWPLLDAKRDGFFKFMQALGEPPTPTSSYPSLPHLQSSARFNKLTAPRHNPAFSKLLKQPSNKLGAFGGG